MTYIRRLSKLQLHKPKSIKEARKHIPEHYIHEHYIHEHYIHEHYIHEHYITRSFSRRTSQTHEEAA